MWLIVSRIFSKYFSNTCISRLPLIKLLHSKLLRRYYKKPIRVNNYYMILNEGHNDLISEHLISYDSIWEKGTTNLFKKLLKSDDTVLDIGANTGYFTLLAASLVGETGKVFAFEPDPISYKLLINNIEINRYKNIIPIQKAALDKKGQIELFQYDSLGVSSIFKSPNVLAITTVESTSLDQYFKNIDFEINLIKMDIEGAELQALTGMTKLLNNPEVILITEFNPCANQKIGVDSKEFWGKLTDLGFYIYIINEVNCQLESIGYERALRLSKNPNIYTNLVCIKSVNSVLKERLFQLMK